MNLDGTRCQVGAAVGLVRLGTRSAGAAEAVFAEADVALYAAKRGGCVPYHIARGRGPAET